MRGELLQVEPVLAGTLQVLGVAALAASRRAVDHDEPEVRGKSLQFLHHPSPVSPVAALEGFCVPADLAQDVRHRARALAAAPAIDEGAPVAVLAAEQRLDMPRDVLREERSAWLARVGRGGRLGESTSRGGRGVTW